MTADGKERMSLPALYRPQDRVTALLREAGFGDVDVRVDEAKHVVQVTLREPLDEPTARAVLEQGPDVIVLSRP